MKKYLFFCICSVLLLPSILFSQEQLIISKSVVLTLKGKVLMNNKTIHHGDTIYFNEKKEAKLQFEFSNSDDWIKVLELKNKKVHHFYQQKKYACKNCLGTRGFSSSLGGTISLEEYIGKRTIFLFETDTLNFYKPNRMSSKVYAAVFIIYKDGMETRKIVGNFDTIIISRHNLFGSIETIQSKWPSFQTDSIKLVYMNLASNQLMVPKLPAFNVFFFEDAICFLKNIGLTDEEIFIELKDNYIDFEAITNKQNFPSYTQSEEWLRRKINNFATINNLK